MTRIRLGSHGQIAKRTDGTIGMTIRPEVRVWGVEDVAAIIASRYEFIDEPNRWSDEPLATYQETWQKIMEENLTKKEMMRVLTDCWYIANYENWTDLSIRIDPEVESHQAMLDFIYMKFPKFRTEEQE